jgi:isopentenyldiphosphate isomerase
MVCRSVHPVIEPGARCKTAYLMAEIFSATLLRVDERVDVLDADGEPTGEVVWKSEAHRRGLYHRCFHCWVFGVDGAGKPYLLVQRRATTKDIWPGYLDVTAAGHIAAGEEPLGGGLRELEEELGLRVEAERLVPLGTRRVEHEIPGGLDRELHHIFFLFDSTPPGELRLQSEEVEAVLGIGLDAAEALGGTTCVLAVEYAGGEENLTQIRISDFVPNEDDYLRCVARAVRRLLAGESPRTVF